jgi:transcription elongation factor GreA
MAEKKEYLTKEKFDQLTAELDHLRKVVRKEVAEDLEYAKSLGDLSENAEYHEAREMQASTEDRITTIETILKNAEIVSAHHTENVGIGSVVTIRGKHDSKDRVFEIVGSEESDIATGKLSIHSPLGSAMIGKKKDDSFSFTSPKGTMHYTIVTIK